MAGTSLLALIDDIATLLDDVALLTKVAAKKTTGVLGDDLALNAEQVSGVRAERELPIVWAVFKGSLRNKLILVPAALAISALAPWAITPLLMLGGAFLCYEGFEKLAHKFLHSRGEDGTHKTELAQALANPAVDLAEFERDKIKGAVRTDFILSAEIIVITLGTVAAASFGTQVAVLAGIAILMTIGVYGLVAGIVTALRLVRESPALSAWFATAAPPIGAELAEQSDVIAALTAAFVSSLGSDHPANVAGRGRWLVRVITSLLIFPGRDEADERAMVTEFVAPVVVPVDPVSPAPG